jgi:iron complex outermembrane receptor protein
MSLKMKLLPLAIAQVVAGGALTVLSLSPAMAQQVSADTQQPVQRVEITGSNIRRADAETPSPVQVISSDDLKKSGYTSVADVLQHISANGQGTLSQGFSAAFAGGASGISLRGLNTSATLVLIDGHRMAPYPLSDDGQRQFVDISNIPFEAVDHIEILKDGASATYGSDAMAGVVNVILKKSYIGTTASAEAGTATEGGGTTYHASVMHGFGDLDADGYNAYFNLEVRHQDDITYSQRNGDGLWTNTNWTAYPGGSAKTPGLVTPLSQQPATLTPYLTNPNLPFGPSNAVFLGGACTSYSQLESGGCQYQNPHAEIQPTTQNLNLLGSFTKKLGGDWQVNTKASLFDSKGEQYSTLAFVPPWSEGMTLVPQSFNGNTAIASGVIPHQVGTPISQITVPANYPGNTLGAPAVVNGVLNGAGSPHTEYESKAYRLSADLTGTLGDWDITSSLGYSKNNLTQNIYGSSINTPALVAALNRPVNPYNLVGPNTAADMAAVFPTVSAFDTSQLDYAEFHATRSLMQLQGGDLGFSTGAEYVRRVMDSPAPLLIAEGIVNGNNAYVEGTQTDASLYMEFAAPVLKTLEIDGSARYDHFNNAGNATTPKLGFKFTPTESFALRGTAAKGFRAPNAAENGDAGLAYGGITTAYQPLCPGGPTGNAAGNAPAKGSVLNYCNYTQTILSSSNPDLNPEKSTSETLGAILEPIKGWSSTIDLYQITIKDQIVTGPPSANPVLGAPISTLCADGNGGSYQCTTPTGIPLYYQATYVNANSTQTRGLELESRYKFKLGDYGNLTTEIDWTHAFSYTLTENGVSYELAGTHGPSIIGGDTGNPKDKVQLTFTWDKGPLQVATIFNWTSSFDLTDPSYPGGGPTTCGQGLANGGFLPGAADPVPASESQFCNVKSFLETDLSVKYKLDKQWTLHASVTNLFNQPPPVDLQSYGGGALPFNPSMHMAGAIGRFIDVGAVYKF